MKIKKYIALFIIVTVIVGAGFISKGVPKLLGGSAIRLVTRQKGISDVINDVDTNLSERLSYHFQLLDLNSLVMRVTGTKVVDKGDSTVVVSEDNFLTEPYPYISDDDIDYITGEVEKLKKVSNDNGAEFLYVFAPRKSIDIKLPSIVDNYSYDNYKRYIAALNEKNIEVFDLYQKKCEEGISTQDMFFITDHHWKPEYGFWANSLICQELNQRYGFEYDGKTTDINNYDVKVYQDWFLGSYGKKTGRYYTPLGLDDFSLITPKFETSLIEEQPFKDLRREGDFPQTALDLSNIETKDIHNKGVYATYSGGDYRLQIFTNYLAPNNDRIIIVRDSFACAVTPFLALNAKELYITDVRENDYYVGDKLNLEKYISEINPDYVIVLYSGVASVEDSAGRYDFF